MALQCKRFERVSASVKTTFAFSLVWRNNACVSHACLHRLRLPCVFFGIASQIMRFKCVSASVKTAFPFFFGCSSVILLRLKIGMEPPKHDVISMSTNTNYILLERSEIYGPNQNIQ